MFEYRVVVDGPGGLTVAFSEPCGGDEGSDSDSDRFHRAADRLAALRSETYPDDTAHMELREVGRWWRIGK